jgi:hypothetical protein
MINKTKTEQLADYTIIARLDDAIPLYTNEWLAIERQLNQISEFVPISMLNTLTEALVNYADDQARRGYILGQEDMASELRYKVARVA